jgi:hypothetical protein
MAEGPRPCAGRIIVEHLRRGRADGAASLPSESFVVK